MNEIKEILTSPKVAAGVATATTGTGLGTFLEAIPNDIGKLATLVGIVLSVVLIYVHVLNVRKVKIEIEILRRQSNDG